jgi:Family of unknown function (DUF5309)
MAIVTNTFQSTSAVGNRQEIDNVVSRITPEDTPIYSSISKGKTNSTSPEWEIDTLRAPAANAQLEGDEYAFGAITPPVRVKNYTQIFRQGWIVSNTQEAIDNVGNNEKFAEKKLKSAIEVRKDVELSIVSNTASVAGATRVSGGLPSWLTTNVSRGATGANGGYSVGTGLTVAETTGTQRAFTKALMDTVMGMVYTSGGDTKNLVVSPYVKSVFVTFMSDTNVAVFRNAVSAGQRNTIIGNADMYDGPYGTVSVVPNRVMATSAATARRAFFIDPSKMSWLWLRPLQEDPDLAKTGDARKGMIIGEGTLKVKNEAGLGVVADIFGLTAST